MAKTSAPTTTAASSAAPPYAVLIWTNGRDILCQIPHAGNADPYIMRFPLSEGGLGKALAVLCHGHVDFAAPAVLNSGPKVKAAAMSEFRVSPQQDHALAVLKRMGLVK